MSWSNDNHDYNKYSGFFTPRPDETRSGVWGSTEVHRSSTGPNTYVEKDHFGNVTKVETRWFDY